MHNKGTVFNIQHFSIHDGPGIRTVVFLKGCPLRCKWCGNPESQRREIEMGWTENECIHCGGCIREMKPLECRFDAEGHLFWDRNQSFDIDETERVCPSKAFHVIGEIKTVEDIIQEVSQDQIFYETSGGGMTLSGGEPLMQSEFTLEVLRAAGQAKIHRAIETTLFAKKETVLEVCGELDQLIMDIKSMDSEKHKKWTGVPNEIIIENLAAVRQTYPDLPILVRTPVIPGFNDSIEDIAPIVDYLMELQMKGKATISYEPLKYHRLGLPKYQSLNREYEMGEVELTDECFTEIKKYVNNNFFTAMEMEMVLSI